MPRPRPGIAPVSARTVRARTTRKTQPESLIAREIFRSLNTDPDRLVLWRHRAGAIVHTVQCPNPACRKVFRAHDHALGERLDAGLGTGTGDFVGLVEGGRLYQAEVKTEDGTETPAQTRRRALINRLGGYAVVVRSADEARAHAVRAAAGHAAPGDDAAAGAGAMGADRALLIERTRAQYWRLKSDALAAWGEYTEAGCNGAGESELDALEAEADAIERQVDDALAALRALGAEP